MIDFLEFGTSRTSKNHQKQHLFQAFNFSNISFRLVFHHFLIDFSTFFYDFSNKNQRKSNRKNGRLFIILNLRYWWIWASILYLQLYAIALIGPLGRLFGAILGHLARSASSFCSSWLHFRAILPRSSAFFGTFCTSWLDHFRLILASFFDFGDPFSMILGSFVVRPFLFLFFVNSFVGLIVRVFVHSFPCSFVGLFAHVSFSSSFFLSSVPLFFLSSFSFPPVFHASFLPFSLPFSLSPYLPFFLSSFLPVFLSSVLSSLLPFFLSSFLPFFHSSLLPVFLSSVLVLNIVSDVFFLTKNIFSVLNVAAGAFYKPNDLATDLFD